MIDSYERRSGNRSTAVNRIESLRAEESWPDMTS